MSFFEQLLGSAAVGLLHVVLGAYVVAVGAGAAGPPDPAGGGRRKRPVLVVGGVVVMLFGLLLGTRSLG